MTMQRYEFYYYIAKKNDNNFITFYKRTGKMKNNTEFPSVRPGTYANKTGKGVEQREMDKKNRRASRLIDSSTKKNIFFKNMIV